MSDIYNNTAGGKMAGLRFDGRVVIVTGAGQGLGKSYAQYLATLGASVVVNDLGESAHAVAAEITGAGGSAVAVTGSVADEDAARSIVEAALAKFHRIDGLINNAGIGFEKPFIEMPTPELRRIMDVNFFGTLNMMRAVYPAMAAARYGRILNVTSASIFGLGGWATYAGAKAANFSFGRSVAIEWQDTGIKVNLLAPAALTPMLTLSITDPGVLESVKGALPELVAPVAAYLVHEDVSFTGRSYFSGSGHVSALQLGTTKGCKGAVMTIDTVAEMIASGAMEAGLTAYATTYEQTAEQV
jgi:NAD(P)-dependent dehydrogenase (short-subunit alcohol dehydrogenase family)